MRLKPYLLLLALLGTGEAAAVGLGEITIVSRLGDRFRAEVPLIESGDDNRLLAECFRLSQPPADADIPVLNRGHVTLERLGGQRRLLITSEQTINEPILQLSVRAGCGAEIVRNYSVLIDPASATPVPAPARRSASVVAEPVSPAASSTRTEPLAASPVRTARKKSAASRTPSAGRLAYRLVISDDHRAATVADADLPLRMASELNLHSPHASDAQRAVLRLEYRLLTTLYDRAGEQLDLAEQVRNLETSLVELQVAAANSALPTAAPAPERQATAAVRPATTKNAATALNSMRWFEPAALLGLAGLIGLLAWVLRRRARLPVVTRPQLETDFVAPVEPAAAPPVQADPVSISRDDTVFVAAPLADTCPPSSHAPGETVLTEDYDYTPVMELADIMLTFGRLQGAAQALQEYIARNPTEAIQPWLKLFDIYRQGNMRDDFESLAERLRQHFNIAAPAWQATDQTSQEPLATPDAEASHFGALLPLLPNIAQHPHIGDTLTRCWSSPDCVVYLNKLLRDNRDGERQGFSPAMVSELLFLIDQVEKRRKA
jgi:pilus assembly protein FimV